ncbi:hypothetical protein T484DRAFT_1763852 [Baffinella frigidus]|nr:hypothetical protein T484DRAFT_1763852 [Cryptophyta sp. CCMP2293]
MQRMKRRQGKLSQDQLTVLESLDFSWGLHAGWDERYRQLIAFRDEYGHVNVPQKFENNNNEDGTYL